jgi:CRISPR system Cascade subunit CasE
MFFSMITPAHGQAEQAVLARLKGAYCDHQWLWQFFPTPEGSPRDFLFRRAEVDGLPRFYVVSARPPTTVVPGWDVQTRSYAPQLATGSRLRFELRVNPVITRRGGAANDTKRRKSVRHDVVMHAKRRLLDERGLRSWKDWHSDDKPALYALVYSSCRDWLMERAERAGFELDEPALSVDGYTQHSERRPRGKEAEELQFSTVDFSGTLTVTNPENFRQALFQGLGHAKAFGCGLLLIRRL